MRRTRRPLVLLSTVCALTVPAAGAVLFSQATAGAEALPVVTPAALDVAAEPAVAHGLVKLPAARPTAVRPSAAATHAAPKKVATRTRVAATRTTPRTVVHTTAPAPIAKPAPKPASTSTTTQKSGVDDYPYRTDGTGGADPWGFTKRQCVSFVAWRLAQHGRALNNARDNWGSALNWDDTARRLGRGISTRPVVGAVAQWNAGESSPYYSPGSATANGHFAAGGYGHVGWVKAVYGDGSALIEQYNMGGSRSYSVMRVKAPRYLLL